MKKWFDLIKYIGVAIALGSLLVGYGSNKKQVEVNTKDIYEIKTNLRQDIKCMDAKLEKVIFMIAEGH